ncbi:hypothetical protein C6P50_12970 [Enterococcus mundtii]|uniref:Uncharacterized protein n=1 Tax=Enterococcus mundtii TaxID=53346 RepID=A0A2T5DF17_ENTMU|nr:hypothetical protein AX758_06335 [Enterococcus mundtii]GEN17931.1 hypothetical protein LAC02_12120 [Ligilactobacillus acidipiscis]PQC30642.1 hypothetical protein CUM97_07755 [Enterococcus mundtii]PTO36670.1 hypothetical protein C6N14_02795 [Enterococcus mundtii]PTO37966.1 hypothetical protein C6P50_12970 [Enterococcus mundtii]
MKLKTIRSIRVVKIIQSLLSFSSVYLLIKGPKYVFLIPLLFGFLLELILPKEYGGGIFKNKKNVFIHSDKIWIEPLIGIILLIIFIIFSTI